MPGKIFINYRRGDEAGWTQALFGKLQNAFAREQLFMDVDNIPAGIDFVRHLDEQVASCDVVLSIIGPDWLGVKDGSGVRRLDRPDDFVRIEVGSALRQEKRVIPVLVNNAEMPRADDLPDDLKPLARRNAVRLTHERFNPDAEGLIRQINGALEGAEAARQQMAQAVSVAAAEAERRRAVEAEDAERRRQEETRLKAIAGLSPEQIAKAEELANWEFIKDNARTQDFRDHLARFPKGVAERMARAKLEALVWAGMGAGTNRLALEAYLEEFPDGPNAGTVRARLDAIHAAEAEAARLDEEGRKELAAWTTALETGEIAQLEAFLRERPKSSYAAKARVRIRELQRSKRVEAEVERWPVVLAAAFAVVALPLCFGVGVMFDSADLRFRFLNPVLMISAPETEFASGVLATGLTLLLLAMSVVFARRRRITGVEIALYWFGVAAALIVPVALALVGMTANADLVSNAGRGAWDFANLGSFRPSLIAGSVAALVSGGMLWFVRRERVSGAEVAIYWMGLAWIGSLLAGANGPVATDVSNAMLLTGSIAADASLLVIFFRRTTISRVEVIIYLLAFAGPLGFGSFLSSVSGSGNASNVLAAWTVPVVLGGALLVWAMIERRSRRPV